MKMRTAAIALSFFMFSSIPTNQGQDNTEPTWQETADFIARTLEHYGRAGYCAPASYDKNGISNVTISAKNLSYHTICRFEKEEVTHIMSFPLDKLDVGTIQVSKTEEPYTRKQVFEVVFFCLEGSCVQDTLLSRVQAGVGGQWGEPEKTAEYAFDAFYIDLTDEDAANRLVRALKHLALLAGSPRELLNH
jgi:hypothetical protein